MTSTNGHRSALAYIRVSSDRGRRETLQSPELQRAAIDTWAAARNIEIVGTFEDRNRSGAKLTRRGLQAALALVPEQADGLVVAHGSRASRRTLDALGMIDDLEGRGGFIAAADGTIDTTTPMTKMATTMNFAMGERELDDLRAKAAEVHARAIRTKMRHMGPAPFGYRRDDDARLVVHPAEAAVVQWIFEARADGQGWAAISRQLDEQGVRDQLGRRLTPQRVTGIVGRRTYTGVAFHGPHAVAGAHPAIIDDVLYEAANRARPTAAAPRRSKRPILLGGLVRCAGCSYGMKNHRQRSGNLTWSCRTLAADRTAAHECEHPARVGAGEHADLERVVVERAKQIAADVYAETDATAAVERAQRDLAEADKLLDEISSLDVREAMGAERWGRLVAEAGERRGGTAETLQAARRTAGGDQRRVWLADTFDGLDFDDRRDLLRGIVKAVMVVAGHAPIVERVHVLPIDDPSELPLQGARGVARPWRP